MSNLDIQAQSEADKIVGTYYSPDKDGKVQVFKENGKYYGKTIAADEPRKDTENPDPELRGRDVVGLVFLKGFIPKDGKYVDGTIYDPANGKTYDCTMWLEDGDLHARGYIGISLLGRTEVFERIK